MADRSHAARVLTLLDRALWRVTTASTRFGERRGIDWLTYSPLQLLAYHRMAVLDAPAVAEAIASTLPEARRWIDLGAGSGALAKAAEDRGIDVTAMIPFDLSDGPPKTAGDYDLALSIEVAEHLTPELGESLVDALREAAPMVVFSAAQPGQGGLGHVNEQPPGYWRERFAAAGFSFDAEATSSLSRRLATADLHATWLRGNIQVFST
jgi:hypothetical protein